MMIEISQLPLPIQQQIMLVEQGESVDFVKNGKVVGVLSPKAKITTAIDVLMAYDGVDVADIDFEAELDVPSVPSPNRFVEFD